LEDVSSIHSKIPNASARQYLCKTRSEHKLNLLRQEQYPGQSPYSVRNILFIETLRYRKQHSIGVSCLGSVFTTRFGFRRLHRSQNCSGFMIAINR